MWRKRTEYSKRGQEKTACILCSILLNLQIKKTNPSDQNHILHQKSSWDSQPTHDLSHKNVVFSGCRGRSEDTGLPSTHPRWLWKPPCWLKSSSTAIFLKDSWIWMRKLVGRGCTPDLLDAAFFPILTSIPSKGDDGLRPTCLKMSASPGHLWPLCWKNAWNSKFRQPMTVVSK